MNNIFMTPSLYILIAIIILGFAAMAFFIKRLQKPTAPVADDPTMKLVLEFLKQVKDESSQTRQEIQKGMDNSNKAINERLDNAARVIGAVTKELGQMQQIGKS
ncbi:MAG: hypothetical protein V4547_20135, partial [Bacteroidota bacterium]